MAVDNYLHVAMREAVDILARTVDQPTATASSPVTPASSAAASAEASSTDSSKGNSSQSPLLFFVALGFGVVFTNLWIIVGVKYCFRYNARNRALARGEAVDQINLEPVHPRPHRRRREKKLMTLDEVNERFPHTKYEAWTAARAQEGLPTAGGVTAPSGSRPATLRNADGALSTSPTSTKHSEAVPEAPSLPSSPTAATTTTTTIPPRLSTDTTEKPITETPVHLPTLTEVHTNATHDDPKHPDDSDDEDALHMFTPALLDHPGDSCAICIEILEPSDDVRGLTCGHAFHASCLDPWLTSRRACCPLCKADYYIPKPRPEGEEERDRDRRRRERENGGERMNLPAPPGSAWMDGRVMPRFFLPGRFGDAGRGVFPTRARTGEGEMTPVVVPSREERRGNARSAAEGRGGLGGFARNLMSWRRSPGASGTTPAQLEAQSGR